MIRAQVPSDNGYTQVRTWLASSSSEVHKFSHLWTTWSVRHPWHEYPILPLRSQWHPTLLSPYLIHPFPGSTRSPLPLNYTKSVLRFTQNELVFVLPWFYVKLQWLCSSRSCLSWGRVIPLAGRDDHLKWLRWPPQSSGDWQVESPLLYRHLSLYASNLLLRKHIRLLTHTALHINLYCIDLLLLP